MSLLKRNVLLYYTYSKAEIDLDVGFVFEVAQSNIDTRLGKNKTVIAAVGVVEQRLYTRHSGGSLEEQSHGERLEDAIAEEGYLQLRVGTAVEAAAFAIHTIVVNQ